MKRQQLAVYVAILGTAFLGMWTLIPEGGVKKVDTEPLTREGDLQARTKGESQSTDLTRGGTSGTRASASQRTLERAILRVTVVGGSAVPLHGGYVICKPLPIPLEESTRSQSTLYRDLRGTAVDFDLPRDARAVWVEAVVPGYMPKRRELHKPGLLASPSPDGQGPAVLEVELQLELIGAPTVRGQIYLDGIPKTPKGARIVITRTEEGSSKSVQAMVHPSSGKFDSNVATGDAVTWLWYESMETPPIWITNTRSLYQNPGGLDIHATSGGVLHLLVLDRHGNPVAGLPVRCRYWLTASLTASVSSKPTQKEGRRKEETATDGSVTIPGLPMDIRVRLEARKAGEGWKGHAEFQPEDWVGGELHHQITLGTSGRGRVWGVYPQAAGWSDDSRGSDCHVMFRCLDPAEGSPLPRRAGRSTTGLGDWAARVTAGKDWEFQLHANGKEISHPVVVHVIANEEHGPINFRPRETTSINLRWVAAPKESTIEVLAVGSDDGEVPGRGRLYFAEDPPAMGECNVEVSMNEPLLLVNSGTTWTKRYWLGVPVEQGRTVRLCGDRMTRIAVQPGHPESAGGDARLVILSPGGRTPSVLTCDSPLGSQRRDLPLSAGRHAYVLHFAGLAGIVGGMVEIDTTTTLTRITWDRRVADARDIFRDNDTVVLQAIGGVELTALPTSWRSVAREDVLGSQASPESSLEQPELLWPECRYR
jgi:hypothetical protein